MRRLGQRQRAGGPGGGDLADAVPDRRGRLDAFGGERRDDAGLDGEEQRLGHVGPGEIGRFRTFQRRQHGPAERRLQQRVDLRHHPAERHVMGERVAPHPVPLRAIAGKDEDRTDRRGPPCPAMTESPAPAA